MIKETEFRIRVILFSLSTTIIILEVQRNRNIKYNKHVEFDNIF